jgi:putative peptide zinc metalloprotease protein
MPTVDVAISLLKAHPVFSSWPTTVLQEFSTLMVVQRFRAGETIVKEGELVDSLYFISEGLAEVSRHDELNPQESIAVALVHQGETIGLSATGLYSTTGRRTATVTAVKSIECFAMKLEVLHEFLREKPELHANLQAATARVWKMQMVKQAAPFAVLTPEQLQWLADKVEEIEVVNNTELFQEGGIGDCCYLIINGTVDIIKDNQSTVSLGSMAIFGETALLLDLPRGATARATTDCRLLQLKRDDLLAIVKEAKITIKLFSRMEKERSCPTRQEGIIIYQNIADDGQRLVTLKNPENYEYYQLSQEGWFVWQLLDGKHSIKDITLAFDKEFNIFSFSLIVSLIANLSRSGFVNFIDVEGLQFDTKVRLPLWMRIIEGIRKVMEAEYPFPKADQWITTSYHAFIKVFFAKPLLIFLSILSIIGIGLFIGLMQHMLNVMPHTSHLLWLIILVDIAALISVPLHELAHAYTTKYFGREVHHFGVGWYWLGPMAFTDTSDMWLATKMPRILVNIAGMFIDTVIASLSSIAAWWSPTNEVAVFFWMFALFCYLGVFHNLYPLIELDGYYILMDWFDRPHLREEAVEWLVEASPKFTKEYRFEMIYWIICLLFIMASPFVAWFIQNYILAHVFPILAQGFWRFLLPLIVVCLSLLSVWVEIQRHRREEQET